VAKILAVQQRPPIERNQGYTPTERRLSALAEKSFLSLWSYPSLFRDQKQGGKGDGKEICDLLVVFGEHIVIFSEKMIEWPTSGELIVRWKRWYRRCVEGCMVQLLGAKRWIQEHPDRIFLDNACQRRFPLSLPTNPRFHLVIVANGADAACETHRGLGRKGFGVVPEICGADHTSSSSRPFLIGDVNPNDNFVHVIDGGSIDFILQRLDTSRDFIDYLSCRELFIRSGVLFSADSEKAICARYATTINTEGHHDFISSYEAVNAKITLRDEEFLRLNSNPQFVLKNIEDKKSEIFDSLIQQFIEHVIGGTSVIPRGMTYSLGSTERALRNVLAAGRVERRSYGEAISFVRDSMSHSDRATRSVIPDVGSGEHTGVVFLCIKDITDRFPTREDYVRYRQSLLHAYILANLERYPHLHCVVGFGFDAPTSVRGFSEDLIAADQHEWTEEDISELREQCCRLEIMRNVNVGSSRVDEYPTLKPDTIYVHGDHMIISLGDDPIEPIGKNRKQRRAERSKLKRRKK